jgi:hypothetical protein
MFQFKIAWKSLNRHTKLPIGILEVTQVIETRENLIIDVKNDNSIMISSALQRYKIFNPFHRDIFWELLQQVLLEAEQVERHAVIGKTNYI